MQLEFYILLALQLFIIGVAGILSSRHHVIFTLIAVEILLLSVNLMLVACSIFFNDVSGQIFVLFILTVAAAESATGLSILILFFKVRGTIEYPFINLIRA